MRPDDDATAITASIQAFSPATVTVTSETGDTVTKHLAVGEYLIVCVQPAYVSSNKPLGKVARQIVVRSVPPNPEPKRPRGTCTVCGQIKSLNIAGQVYGHNKPRKEDGQYQGMCPGGRKPPIEAVLTDAS